MPASSADDRPDAHDSIPAALAPPSVVAPPSGVSGVSGDTAATEPRGGPIAGVSLARHLLTAVAVLGAVGLVLALFLVERVGDTYRDGLEVTADGATVASLSATNAESLARDLVDLIDTSSTTLDEARELVLSASVTSDELGDALGTNIADAVTGTGSIADGLASLIEAIERFIPGDSDSLAEDLRILSDGLEPVPAQLRTLGDRLATSSTQLDAAAGTLSELVTQLDGVALSVDAARDRLVEVQQLSADVQQRAERALDRSDRDLWLMRLLVVVIGAGTIGAALAGRRALDLLSSNVTGAPSGAAGP